MKKTKINEYSIWNSMKQRCFNPNVPNYHNYGGRGITVCERWLIFENFYADMGKRPKGKSIDRKDNDGNYEPSNCRWATWFEQANNRRDNIYFTYKGKTKTIRYWADKYNMNFRTLYNRLTNGWNTGEAITTPVSNECGTGNRTIRKFRIKLRYRIGIAMIDLKIDHVKLAKEYGVHMREGEYTKGRISQLINVRRGQEENSENMLNWMLDKIKENK